MPDCSWEVAGSNLGWGYFAARSAQPSIPLGSVNEYQLQLGRQRQVPLADEMQGVQVKLCYPLTMCAIPECLRDVSCSGAIQINNLYLFTFTRSALEAICVMPSTNRLLLLLLLLLLLIHNNFAKEDLKRIADDRFSTGQMPFLSPNRPCQCTLITDPRVTRDVGSMQLFLLRCF